MVHGNMDGPIGSEGKSGSQLLPVSIVADPDCHNLGIGDRPFTYPHGLFQSIGIKRIDDKGNVRQFEVQAIGGDVESVVWIGDAFGRYKYLHEDGSVMPGNVF